MTQSSDITFEVNGRAGVVTLNKPSTLNAVTDAMLTALNDHLDIWEADSAVQRVIIKAVPGRAFSAGGDIRHLYECGMAKQFDFDFFAREYRLNARIAKFPKPYIALVDGIAMGGGVGVSFHGSHRVAGDNIVFAMPEVGIGFFPDIGASHFLSRIPGGVGLYLGLTGNRVKQSDARRLGLATHTCPTANLGELEEALCSAENLEETLGRFDKPVAEAPIDSDLHRINSVFSAPTLGEIIERLEVMAENDNEDGIWAKRTLGTLLGKSPTSLAIAWHQITAGADLDIDGCMKMEFRILKRILPGPDFYEGIRAAIIDKDNTPRWSPAILSEIDGNAIEAHFANLGDEELVLT